MNIFIISISGEVRMANSTKNLIKLIKSKNGFIEWTGINAVNADQYEFTQKNNIDLSEMIVGGKISKGELGCLLSHQLAYQKIKDYNLDSALIIEDDAILNVEMDELFRIANLCRNSGYEIVNLNSSKGGLLLNSKSKKIASALIMPLSAYSYWISNSGARKMISQKLILGLADWPIQVNTLKRGAITQNIFIHNPEQVSVIAPTLFSGAANRKTLWSKSLLNPRQVFISFKIIMLYKSISVFRLVRILLCQKLFYWIYRILKFKNKTGDSTIKITY